MSDINVNVKVRQKKLSDIKPYWRNPRDNDESVPETAASIKRFGFKVPIVVDRDGVIVTGHTRYKASQELGLETVPVIVADDLSAAEIKAYRLADNKVGEKSRWREEDLVAELLELQETELLPMDEFGFEIIDTALDEPEEAAEEEETETTDFDYEAPAPAELKTEVQPGDIFELGEHRLMCGDSTNPKDVVKLLTGATVDLVLTDPPYGIEIVGAENKVWGDKPATFSGKKIGGDNVVKCNEYQPIRGDETTDTARKFYEGTKDLAENFIIFGGNYFADFLPVKSCWLVWDKKNGGSVFADCELAWTSYDKAARLYQHMWNGMAREGDRRDELPRRIHPTQKPVGLFSDILEDFSKEGETVFDAFGGSGSVLIACEKTGRKCYTMECEPYYTAVIIDRWEQYTGQKAKKARS